MNRIKLSLIIISVLLFSCKSKNENEILSERIDKQLKEYYENGLFSGSVLIVKNDEEIYKNEFGFSDFANKKLINDSIVFYIASVTKQFTAYSILKLVEQGKISLTDWIGEYIEGLPPHFHYLTIEQILNHTSGMPDWFGENLYREGLTNQDIYNWLISQELSYIPGTKYNYSNAGYILLSMLIENVSNSTFSEFLQENIFLPNEMNKTFVCENNNVKTPNKAFAYDLTDQSYDYDLFTTGAGGIYSNTNDLFKWHLFLLQDTLISRNDNFKLYQSGRLKNGDKTNIGFGWAILNDYQGYVLTTGGFKGFRSFLLRSINDNTIIIILSNRSCTLCTKLGFELFKIINNEDVPLPKSPIKKIECKIPLKILEKYIGQYELAGHKIEISLKNGKLFYNEDDMAKGELFAENEFDFFMKKFDLQCNFEFINSRNNYCLTIFSEGNQYNLMKTKE